MHDDAPRLSRRRLLSVIALAGLAACRPDADDEPAAAESRRPPGPPDYPDPPPEPLDPPEHPDPPPSDLGVSETEAGEVPEPEVVLAEPEPYEPLDDETYPNAKRLAGRVAQALTAYQAGATLEEIVAAADLSPAPDLDTDALVAAAAPLHRPAAQSAGEVVYAQLGGLAPLTGTPTAASVMVVLRQRLLENGVLADVTRTIDVRLTLVGGVWALEGLGDVGREPVERPSSLPRVAEAVLDDDRIDLPDSARWDIHRGEVDRRLLRTMLAMADLFPYSVSSLVSGHPERVFGTRRESNHLDGRAVDVWAVDGVPVVTHQPDRDTPTYELLEMLFEDNDVESLGGPWALDGFGGRSFADDVHLDHLHIAHFRVDD